MYMAKKYDEILIACNVSWWDIYNSVADTYIKLYKYESSIYISNNMF